MNFHFSSFESKYRKTNADIQYPTIPKIQACVLLHNNENTKVNDKEVSSVVFKISLIFCFII